MRPCKCSSKSWTLFERASTTLLLSKSFSESTSRTRSEQMGIDASIASNETWSPSLQPRLSKTRASRITCSAGIFSETRTSAKDEPRSPVTETIRPSDKSELLGMKMIPRWSRPRITRYLRSITLLVHSRSVNLTDQGFRTIENLNLETRLWLRGCHRCQF